MRRIVINCLLLVCLVTAESDDRQKRHLSFIKNLISSTLFGSNQRRNQRPTTHEGEKPTYEMFRIPGYENVLIKAIPSKNLEETIRISRPNQVLKINPFESYIGAENPRETLVAMHNVNNLLSTDILDGHQSKQMKKVMVPIIADAVKVLKEEHPAVIGGVIPELDQYEVSMDVQEPLRTVYSYKQLLNQDEVVGAPSERVVVRERIDSRPLPECIQERIDEVISVGADPTRLTASVQERLSFEPEPAASGQYPYFMNTFPSSNSKLDEAFNAGFRATSKLLQETVHPIPTLPFENIEHTPSAVRRFNLNSGPKKTQTRPVTLQYTPVAVDVIQESEPTEEKVIMPKDSKDKTSTGDIKTVKTAVNVDEVKPKMVPHYVYNQVYNAVKNDTFEIVKEKNQENNESVDIRHVTNKPTVANEEHAARNVDQSDKNTDNKPHHTPSVGTKEKKTFPVSHYVYKQGSHNNPDAFTMVKQGDELITNVNIPSDVMETDFVNTAPVSVDNVANAEKVINDNVNIGDSHADSLEPVDNVPKDESPLWIDVLEETDIKINTDFHKSPKNIKPLHTPSIKLSPADTMPILLNVPGIVKLAGNDKNRGSNRQVANKAPKKTQKTVSRYVYKQASGNDPEAFVMEKDGDELKVNVNTDNPFEVMPDDYTVEEESEKTDGTSTESNQDSHRISFKDNPIIVAEEEPIDVGTKSPRVSKDFEENHHVSFKDNPIVVVEGNFAYQQKNADGSSLTVKSSKDGVIFQENFNGRGDIPEQ